MPRRRFGAAPSTGGRPTGPLRRGRRGPGSLSCRRPPPDGPDNPAYADVAFEEGDAVLPSRGAARSVQPTTMALYLLYLRWLAGLVQAPPRTTNAADLDLAVYLIVLYPVGAPLGEAEMTVAGLRFINPEFGRRSEVPLP